MLLENVNQDLYFHEIVIEERAVQLQMLQIIGRFSSLKILSLSGNDPFKIERVLSPSLTHSISRTLRSVVLIDVPISFHTARLLAQFLCYTKVLHTLELVDKTTSLSNHIPILEITHKLENFVQLKPCVTDLELFCFYKSLSSPKQNS